MPKYIAQKLRRIILVLASRGLCRQMLGLNSETHIYSRSCLNQLAGIDNIRPVASDTHVPWVIVLLEKIIMFSAYIGLKHDRNI